MIAGMRRKDAFGKCFLGCYSTSQETCAFVAVVALRGICKNEVQQKSHWE